MSASLLGKIAAWGQLVINVVGTLATSGIPSGAAGWLTWLSSLAVAIGTHAASSTSAAK